MIGKKFSYSPPLQHRFFSFIRTEYSIAFTIYLLVHRLLAKLALHEGEPGGRPVHQKGVRVTVLSFLSWTLGVTTVEPQ
jgi:hypothetical protein